MVKILDVIMFSIFFIAKEPTYEGRNKGLWGKNLFFLHFIVPKKSQKVAPGLGNRKRSTTESEAK